jgi:hypothetical protein
VHFVEYALLPVRLSALAVLTSVINNSRTDLLVHIAELLFVTLAMRLVDESNECRTKARRAITCLVKKIPNEERDKLFELLIQSWQQPKVSY